MLLVPGNDARVFIGDVAVLGGVTVFDESPHR